MISARPFSVKCIGIDHFLPAIQTKERQGGSTLKEPCRDVTIGTNSMEKKNASPPAVQGQLDFNAPLLSVRRHAGSSTENERVHNKEDGRSGSKLGPPAHRLEFQSGSLRKPGTVPFLWEQSPGRPKDEAHVRANHDMSVLQAPRLPPGRTLAAKQAHTKKEELASNGDANTYEPGRRPSKDRFQQFNRLMNGASQKNSKPTIDALVSNAKDKSVGSGASRPHPGIHISQNCALEEDLGLEDCDTYSDAAETLSQTESCTVACSVSIVSGMEDQDLRSGRFVDAQTRNFMFDRFLSAAKAMASESPQNTSRRPPVQDPIRHVSKGGEDRGPLPFHSMPYFMKKERKEDGDDISGFSSKACGFFSWRLRNSFVNLNPVSHSAGVSKKKPLLLLSAQDKRKPQSNLSHEVSSSDTDDETWEAIYMQKLVNGTRPSGYARKEGNSRALSSNASPEVGDALMKRLSCGSGSQRMLNRGSSGGISPYRNEAPVSPFHEGTGFLGFPKAFREDNMNYLEAHRKSCNSINGIETEDPSLWRSPSFLGNSPKSTPVSPTYEAAVCIESGRRIGPLKINVRASEPKELMKGNGSNIDVWVANNQKKSRSVITESCVAGDMNLLAVSKDSEVLKSKTFGRVEVVDIHTSMEAEESSSSGRTDHGENESGSRGDNVSLVRETNVKDGIMKEGWPLGISIKGIEISADDRTLVPSNSKSEKHFPVSGLLPPLPPPLPKSPAESWLWRAIPLVTSPSSPLSPHAGLGSPIRKQQQGLKSSIADPNWETIVKSTYAQPGHLRFSEELNHQASPRSGS